MRIVSTVKKEASVTSWAIPSDLMLVNPAKVFTESPLRLVRLPTLWVRAPEWPLIVLGLELFLNFFLVTQMTSRRDSSW
jgi:hypothetical protein